jgi:hypothetical protein
MGIIDGLPMSILKTSAGELIRLTRPSRLTQMTIEPKVPAKDGKL